MTLVFADDALSTISLESPAQTVESAGGMIDVVHETTLSHGYIINYKSTKSGIVVIPKGDGAAELRRDLEHHDIPTLHSSRWNAKVHVVTTYKHLSVPLDREVSRRPRVGQCCMEQKVALGPLRRTFCKLRRLSAKAQYNVADVFAEFHLLYWRGFTAGAADPE